MRVNFMRRLSPIGHVALAVGCLLLGAAFSINPVLGIIDDNNGQAEKSTTADGGKEFEQHIAPLLAMHCLECHDSSSKDGGLDLSRQEGFFSGGDSGPPIVAGDSDASLLWQYVESDDMPQNRAPLSDAEKKQLKAWIDGGAQWTLESIDPDAFASGHADAETWLQRLTVDEYIETVRSAVDVDIEREARRILPQDQRADGFQNTAYNLGVDLAHVQAYARLAKLIVDSMDAGEFAIRFTDCKSYDPECLHDLISNMGKHLLRGPLEEREIEVYEQLAGRVKESGGDFEEATEFILQAMLQSPRFIYRIERQAGDGSSKPVDDYELASRISYILWGGPPDAELMQAADESRLTEPKTMRNQIARMLEDPRAVNRSRHFIQQWLDLDRLDTLRPNPERFPQWNAQLAKDMRDETLDYFEQIVWNEQRPVWDIMNASFTFATPRLAHHYGLYKSNQDRGDNESDEQRQRRVSKGLQALYTFGEGGGDQVHDVSTLEPKLDLQIADPGRVHWRADGLRLDASTIISTPERPLRLLEALQKTNAITIEAWVTPADRQQSGPARIVTLSRDSSTRNFTLGQDADRFETRLRTSETSGNGIPGVSSADETVVTAPTHVVYTRDSSGQARIFIDGFEAGSSKIEGDFSSWDEQFRLAIANELSGDRSWSGTFHLVAIYDRALSVDQVRQNHDAGGFESDDHLAEAVVEDSWSRSDKSDLLALYRFDAGKGKEVHDRLGNDEPLNMRIEDPLATRWNAGGLMVHGQTHITTADPPRRLIDAVKKSRALTLEAWITPANSTQDGPARIVTLSEGASNRNFTLGQDGGQFDARLRTNETDNNGLPSLASHGGSAQSTLTHVVYTKRPDGQVHLFVNGERQATGKVGKNFDNWDDGFRLALANETSGDRPWRGTYHLLAIYNRAMSDEEVQSKGAGMQRHELAEDSPRGGLLTHGSVLTIGGDEASMVARGLFVLHDLLYSRIGNPPPCVDTTPIPAEPGMSNRDLAEVRLSDASCVGCHEKFEPLAFGLEKFDGIGGYQEIDEHGNQLREDGEIRFPGKSQPVTYQTSNELMDILAGSDRVRMALTRKVTQFALGRPLVPSDMPHVEQIHATAQEQGGTYQALMKAILMSDLVRKARTEAQETSPQGDK
jgi:hypothetical protein